MNYIRKLFYRLMAHHYECQVTNFKVDEDEAKFKGRAAKSNGEICLKRLRELGL